MVTIEMKLSAYCRVPLYMIGIMMLFTGCRHMRAKNGSKVYYINSYHAGYPASDKIMEGMQEVFAAGTIDLKTFFLDSKRNPEAVKHHVSGWLVGFPDLRFDVEQMLAEDDYVVSRCVMDGTHSGSWFGISPTGKRVSIRMIVTHRIGEGKIAEDWVLVESLGFFQQLGLVSSTQEILALSAKQQ